MGEEGTCRYWGGYPEGGKPGKGFPTSGHPPRHYLMGGVLKGSQGMARDRRGAGIPTTATPQSGAIDWKCPRSCQEAHSQKGWAVGIPPSIAELYGGVKPRREPRGGGFSPFHCEISPFGLPFATGVLLLL